MTKIEELLISLIRADICDVGLDSNIKQELTENNLKLLHMLADKHSVSNIVSDVLFNQGIMPEYEIKKTYYNSLMSSIMYYEKMKYELERVLKLFEENKIMHMPLKGSVIRKYYREPWLRTSCDIDILIKEEELERAAKLLQENSFELKVKDPHDWGFLSAGGINLELHFKLIETHVYENGPLKYNWNVDCLANIWDNVVLVENKEYQYAMSDEIFYFYHIAHMAKHIEHRGCGVRFFLDLWILNHKKEYDEKRRMDILRNSGLEKFELQAKKLSEVWFSGKEKDKVTEMFEAFIFGSGTYGSIQHHAAIQQNKKGGRVRYILSLIFLPYNTMRKKYTILDKYKWLYPLYLVKRWISIMSPRKLKTSTSMAEIKESIKKPVTETSETGDLFYELGLL